MNDFTWFRLLVRAIGLFVIVTMLPLLVSGLIHGISTIGARPGDVPNLWSFALAVLAGPLGYLAEAGVGVYLFLGGDRVVRYCLRDIATRCPSCRRDVRLTDSSACPACGAPMGGEHPRG